LKRGELEALGLQRRFEDKMQVWRKDYFGLFRKAKFKDLPTKYGYDPNGVLVWARAKKSLCGC
jgi:hypothetical protein